MTEAESRELSHPDPVYRGVERLCLGSGRDL